MKGKGIIFLFGLCSTLSLHSQKINPEKPDLSPENFRFDTLPETEINIPIRISLDPIYQLAEKTVDTLFTSEGYPNEWIQEGCDTRYKYVFRRSPLRMKTMGTTLELGFTGYYKIIGSTRLCVNGTAVSPWTPPCRCGFNEPERRVNVSFSNSLSFQPDFKVNLQFKRNDPRPVDKCEVCFWGQDITKQVMKGLTTELDVAKTDLDKNYGEVDLKPQFQQVWDQLNKVYNLNGLGWLKINPQRIRINNLYAENDYLNVYLGLSARPIITFEQPAAASSWIPDASYYFRKPGFDIYMDAVLAYDSLSNIINNQLAGKEFVIKKTFVKKKFIIDECKVYGGGHDKLIIKINFSGTNTGIVYLVGKPVYKNDSRSIEVEDVDFDIKSKNLLLGSADWLFDKKITKEIKKAARFELGDYIDTARLTLNNQLNREWAKGIRSYGSIEDIRLTGIYPLQQHLVIRSNCRGELSVEANAVDFSL